MDRTEKQLPKLIPLVKGLLVAYGITGITLLLLAFLVFQMDLDESGVNLGIIVIYIVSCFLGGFFVGKKAGRQKFLWGNVSGTDVFFTSYRRVSPYRARIGIRLERNRYILCDVHGFRDAGRDVFLKKLFKNESTYAIM